MAPRITGRTTGQIRQGHRTTGRSPMPVSSWNEQGVISSDIDGRSVVKTYASLGALIGLQEAFPIDSVYSNVSGVDPNIELGYGLWQLFAVAAGTPGAFMEITVQ